MCKYCEKGIHMLFEDRHAKIQIINNGAEVFCEVVNTQYFDDDYTLIGSGFFDIDFCPKCGRDLQHR